MRIYVMPILVVGGVNRGPKYLRWRLNSEGLDAPWAMKDYGLVNACLVVADVTQEQHEALVAEIDVVAAPVDIDQNIGELAIPQVQNVLEALRIPSQWVTTDYTYRDLLRMVAGLFMFAQRHHGLWNEPLIDNAGQLDLRWNQIPLARRQRVVDTADSFGYEYGDITGTWTVRQILRYLAAQRADTPVHFGNLLTL